MHSVVNINPTFCVFCSGLPDSKTTLCTPPNAKDSYAKALDITIISGVGKMKFPRELCMANNLQKAFH